MAVFDLYLGRQYWHITAPLGAAWASERAVFGLWLTLPLDCFKKKQKIEFIPEYQETQEFSFSLANIMVVLFSPICGLH